MTMAQTILNGLKRPASARDALARRTRFGRAPVARGPEEWERAREPLPGIAEVTKPPAARAPGLRARLQMLVWQRLSMRLVEVSDIPQEHRVPSEADYVRPIPAGRRYPGLVDTPLIFSENTPISERHDPLEVAVIRAILWLKEWYAMGDSLNQLYTGIGAPYPDDFAKYQPRPTIPEDFLATDKLAGVARRGPFSLQTRREGDDEFVLDLRALEGLTPRAPFIAAGGLARFQKTEGNNLRTVQIEFRGEVLQPGDPGWSLAEKRFLVGLNSYTTFVEHLVFLHIASAGVWSIVARMAFSARHPLRILLQPFTEETSRVNNYNIDGLILSEHSNVPLYSGYSLEQSDRLLRVAGKSFDVRIVDPEWRARAQGQLDDPTFPTVQSAVAVYRIFRRFTSAWCEAYLQEIDLETRIFCEELDFRVANGVRRLIGIESWDELTQEHVAHLLAVGAFCASIGHHIVNDLTRDYMLSFHLMPPAITAEGYSTLGVVLEKQASVFTAGIQRYRLMSHPFIPDERGRRIWGHFQAELAAYEASLATDPATEPYSIHPSRAASSIHA